MRKRTGIILVGILAIALAVAAFFLRKEKQVVVIDPWEAVPADAFFVIETSDFPELLTRITDPAGILSGLSGLDWAASLVRSASSIDSVTGGREVRELISNRRMLISFHAAGQRQTVPLAVMSTGPAFTARKLTLLCSQAGATVTDKRDLGGTRTFTLTFTRGSRQKPVYLALTSGILIITPSESMITAALDNRSAGSDIRHQQGFTQVVSAAGKTADNLFVLFRNLPPFLKSFTDPEDISVISSVAIAGGGDLTTAEDGLFISGFLTTAGAGTGADRLRDVAPAENGVHELLPRNTLSYSTVMRRASLSGETATDPASINATDLALILSPFTGTEVTEGLIAFGEGSVRIRLFRMTDPQSAEEVLRQRLAAKYRSMGLRESHFVASARNSDGAEEVIYRMPFTGVASILAGAEKSRAGDEWVTFARSYMIFSQSPEALAAVLRESAGGNTLINDPGFREMEKSLPTKSSFLFYSSGRVLKSQLAEYLTPAAAASLTDRALSGISGVGVSMTPSNEMIYTSLSVRYTSGGEHPGSAPAAAAATEVTTGETDSSGLKLLWKVKLDAAPSVKPFFFTNHNTGATEIFIQDRNNNIYLISSSGKILWKAAIREKITGDIFMIDYYKNGKLQLLFTGRDYMHLIDRNGNYVDKFPVKMQSPASNTLALFDYENNKDYRLFIAGDDRKIYAYDRSGTPVRGWNLFTARGKVTDPVTFFRVRGKDYLFVADDQAVYVLDRTGNIRVAHQEPLMKAPGSVARLTAEDEPSIIFSALDGATVRLLFDGTVKKDTIRGISASHRSEFGDIDGDDVTDRLTVDQGVLRAIDGSGHEMWRYSAGGGEVTGPWIVSTGTDERRIAIYDTGKGMLHLIGRNGASVSGFPRPAGPLFNTGKVSNKSTWNLISVEDEIYLCNHELNSGSK
ncbi:MAG: hypothetical protein KBB24_04085 [Bacteroidales bacterium]|nr:hypothetical protein [Bacteroidales bacterium]MDX9926807.1 hypothetical protein [Bacteroidales bacterium]HNX83978.1 hypothetical protein [Bacteroidales bacterium]HOC47938.1 hypothetical protein [Bacteroidales bacterium]HPS96856.1 hypothetical protein [Bacteroidales bacterium]